MHMDVRVHVGYMLSLVLQALSFVRLMGCLPLVVHQAGPHPSLLEPSLRPLQSTNVLDERWLNLTFVNIHLPSRSSCVFTEHYAEEVEHKNAKERNLRSHIHTQGEPSLWKEQIMFNCENIKIIFRIAVSGISAYSIKRSLSLEVNSLFY